MRCRYGQEHDHEERNRLVGWLKDKLFNRRSADAPTVGLCDCCNSTLMRTRAYFLPTRKIVLSQAYWATIFALGKGLVDGFGVQEQQLVYFSLKLRFTASQRNSWSVCENCSEFFIFDRNVARSHAIHNSRPAGTGEVDPSGCVLFAAAAWEEVFGRWPANVTPHTVLDACDLCRRKIYTGGISSTVPQARMAEFRVEGIIDNDPVSPLRPGEGDWVICQPCTCQLHARCHRADIRPA